MDTKEIVEKAVKGEDYTADLAKFPLEEQPKVLLAIKDAASSAAKTELDKADGIRKERQRQEDKSANAVFDRFAGEQLEKARQRFYSEPRFKVTDEEKAKIEDTFKKLGSDKVDADLIYQDLVRAYGAVKAPDLMAQTEKLREDKKTAEDFIAGQAGGSNFGGSGGQDDDKFTQPAKDLYKDWQREGIKGRTLEDAQKLVNRGRSWKSRDLSA